MIRLTIFCLIILLSNIALSQDPYTQNLYGFTVQSDVEYGQAINFAGINDTLLLDIYKPVGDNNCLRPCLILVHGGSWIAGSKEDVDIVNISSEFAKKGWVVAAVNYRLGTHKTSNYTMYAVCNNSISAPCGYIADSAEVIRANYRGQQDVKGAIRFMKNRYMLDSTDVNNVFIAGESAGGFVSLASAFLNDPSEKSPFCSSISDAPNPDNDLISCLPANYSLSRPDLGDIDGTLNLGNYDASIEGVGNFFGGMMDITILSNESNWPAMYLFHQGSDVIVHYNYGRILGRIDWECYAQTNICQTYAFYPKAFGSKGIDNYLNALTNIPVKQTEIIENYEYLNDCFDNGHSIDNWITRSQNMADFFAVRVSLNGNTPSFPPCNLGIPNTDILNVTIYPNPSSGIIKIEYSGNEKLEVEIYSNEGKLIKQEAIDQFLQIELASGSYLLRCLSESVQHIKHVIIQ